MEAKTSKLSTAFFMVFHKDLVNLPVCWNLPPNQELLVWKFDFADSERATAWSVALDISVRYKNILKAATWELSLWMKQKKKKNKLPKT